jgi:superfamily II DNA or RNA helicase
MGVASALRALAEWTEAAPEARILWIAPKTELVDQAVAAFIRAGFHPAVEAAGSKLDGANPGARIVVSTVQTAIARKLFGPWLLVVFDEAHMSAAQEWSTLLTADPKAKRLGLTATPARQDGVGLGAIYDVIVVAATISQLTEQGDLVPLDIIGPSHAYPAGKLAQSPLKAYREHIVRRHALLFAGNIPDAARFAGEFISAGISASVLTGKMSPDERAATLDRFKDGTTRVLCSVGILTTGFDFPPVAFAILARRVGSVSLLIQMAGRILRPARLKTRAYLLDLAGSVHIPGNGPPDEDRVYSLEGRGIRSGEAPPEGSFCAVCGALIEGAACVDCGYERPAAKETRVMNAPIRRLARDACKADSPATQLERLRKFGEDARRLGHKPTSALFKFQGLYGRMPTDEEKRAAGVFRRPGTPSFAGEGEKRAS